MSWEVLNDQIKTKLDAISDVQFVYDYPWLDFDGYPAMTITPSDLESDYYSQQHNRRVYAFIIRAFVDIDVLNETNDKEKVKKATEIMRGLMDTVTDTFDSDETLTGISSSMPSGKTLVSIVPVPGVIRYFEEERMVYGELTLNCQVLFDTTS